MHGRTFLKNEGYLEERQGGKSCEKVFQGKVIPQKPDDELLFSFLFCTLAFPQNCLLHVA